MYEKSEDHLKVTWYIIRFKKCGLQKYPGVGGFRLSAHGLLITGSILSYYVPRTILLCLIVLYFFQIKDNLNVFEYIWKEMYSNNF